VSFNKALKLRAKRAGPGRKPPRFNKGWWFYRSLQPQLLDLLMEGESTAFDDYPADLLFGMAIKKAFNKGEGFHEDVRRLTYAATMANPPSIRAMGIFERINRAIVPVNLNIKASDAREMLYDAAASGSLTALSDLHKLNPDMASLAVQHFRSSGGYNRESLLAFKVPPLIIVEKMTLAAFSEDSSALEELGLDIRTRKGALGYFDDYNTLLHLAATFGACNVIRYLVEIRKMEVDTQNAYGETPLYKSCVAGQYESAMLLLDLGANPSIRAGEMQVTCLHWLLVFDPAHMECIAGRLISNYLRVDETVNPILLFKGYEQYPFETMNHFPFHWPIGTPLHWAAHMGNVDAVITLFKHGSSVDVLDAPNDAQSQTPLSMAMYRADSVIVKLLLDNGANPSRADGKGRTPLHMLAGDFWMQNRLFPISKSLLQWCSHGDFESSLRETGACINAIIEAGALLNSERHDSALTPLMDAVNNENVVAANALLDAGADANSYRDWSGRLPLHVWATIQPDRLAYPEGYFPTLEKFLNCTRETSLPHKTITSLVLETMSPQSIDDTFWRQKLDMMLSHRYHQININARNDDGTNILLTLMNIQKSDMNYWDAVQWLRRKGADIAARDNRDRDFLWYTSENREVGDLVCLKLTRLYLECVMNKSKEQVLNDSKDSDSGMTALMSLCGNGYVESVRHMLEVGVEVNDSDKNGRTALDYSLDTGNRFRLGLWTNFLNYLGRMPNASDNPTDDLFQRSGIGKDLHEGQGSHAKVKSTKDKYFAFPQITAALIDAHGKTGKQLGRRLNAPDIKSSEKEILDFANVENFQVENQPFYELWEQAYQFDDDTKEEIDQLSFNKKGWSVPPAIRDMIREREEREEREERSKTS
jgi:ankyrin repeat protein